MVALVGKVAVVAVLVYISLVLVDAACAPSLSFCQLYEPFSPW